MAGYEFLNSIEINYKKAVACLQESEGIKTYTDELANQSFLANSRGPALGCVKSDSCSQLRNVQCSMFFDLYKCPPSSRELNVRIFQNVWQTFC